MKFENNCIIPVPQSKLWAFLTDIPKVATCLPGVEEVHAVDEKNYSGTLSVKVGIIKLRMSGKILIEQMDAASHTAIMAVQASDQRISGMVQGRMTMSLHEVSPQETRLKVGTDLNLMGKIGEFGQSIVKKKADQMMDEFARNLAAGAGA